MYHMALGVKCHDTFQLTSSKDRFIKNPNKSYNKYQLVNHHKSQIFANTAFTLMINKKKET